MTPRGKTIQIYLPGGDPRGIRVAEITTRIVQVIEVPRSLLEDFLEMPESGQVSVYFLVGESDDEAGPRVYTGQSGDLRLRLSSHNKTKDFWERVFVLISRTNSLTQTHVLFLEWFALQAAATVGRSRVENGTSGTKPHTPAPLEADCLEIFETGQTLMATLGLPIFESVISSAAKDRDNEVFFCNTSGADARGLYTSEGFVVLKGSVGRRENVPSIVGTSNERLRAKLIEASIMRAEGDRVIFEKDHLFGSPSMAGMAVLGRTANGWITWLTADGRTLDAVKRR